MSAAKRTGDTTEGTFAGHGDVSIRWRRAAPDVPPRAVVLLSHGYGEHLERYADVTAHLVGRGFAVAALDHRGHGRSGGPRGHCSSFAEMVADLRRLADHAETWWPRVPRLLLGHSMGGLIGFLFLLDHPDTVRAAVLTAPAFRVPYPLPPPVPALARFLGLVAPRLRFRSAVDADALSRDTAVGRAYVADPLVHRDISAGFFRAMHRGQKRARAEAPTLKVPTMILQGDADRVVVPAGTPEVGARLGSNHEVRMLPGYYHELLNEPPDERAHVLALLDRWFQRWLAG